MQPRQQDSNDFPYSHGGDTDWNDPLTHPKPANSPHQGLTAAQADNIDFAHMPTSYSPNNVTDLPRGTTTPKTERSLVLTPMAIVEAKRQRFLWHNRVPMGVLTHFAGRGGEGKSTFSLWLASQVTRGTLEGEFAGKPASVLLVGHEDDLGTIVSPRLTAVNADMNLVYSMSIRTMVDGLDLDEVPSVTEDLNRIREAITTTGAKLIIVDPLSSVMGDVNLDKTADVRRALNPLAALAAEMDVAIIGILHFRKGQGDTRDLLSGSHAFRDTARSVILFVTDEDTGQRVASIDKSNYSESRGDSFAFALVSTVVPLTNGEQATVARVDFLGESAISVTDIVNKPEDVDLGEAIGAVVDYVNNRPLGTKPAEVAADLGMTPGDVRSYLSRAAKRGLVEKNGYGKYAPSAARIPVVAGASSAALASLELLREASAAREAVRQTETGVALCSICHQPMSPALAGHITHPGCDDRSNR